MIVTAACPTELSAQGLMPLAAQPHELEARGSYCHSASLLILETPRMYTTHSISIKAQPIRARGSNGLIAVS